MENMIISLDQVSPGHWQAKYRGNYGIYNIRIQLNADKLVSFSCSCPSDNYPCKHIEIVVEEIELQSPILERASEEFSTSIKEILQKISHKELKDFVIHYSTYNRDFLNKIQLEFLGKLEKVKETNYSALLKKALKRVHFDYDDLYDNYDSTIEVDIINEWLEKAEAFILQSRFDEAVAILKAIVNEYAEWTETIENDILAYIDPDYLEKPFDLLIQIARINHANANEIFEYAISEIHNHVHNECGNGDRFSDLLFNTASSNEHISRFLDLQDELLNQVENKASYEAEKILNRIILFYQKNNAPDKAAKLIEDNLQIISFRKRYLEQKIAEGNFALAKKIINDSLIDRNTTAVNSHWEWNKMLLFIARKEGDLATIRKLAFSFIETSFNQEYYRLFKSTFPAIEWPDQLKKIIGNYEKDDRYFSTSKANVLVEENNSNELISYIGKHLSVGHLENYYPFFSKDFPGETLDLFYKAINHYAERNTGRNHYDYIVRLLMKMKHIEGGKEKASAMVVQYKILYKNRRAMMEILQRAKI